MPELPEIHTITQDLKKYVTNAKVMGIVIDTNYGLLDNNKFITKLQNKKVTSVQRVAKNIVLELESEDFFAVHLAMTGTIFITQTSTPKR